MRAWLARSAPVALDEVADMFGQFVALDVEPGLNFRRDILRNVFRPVLEGIECDNAKRLVELAGDQIGDDGLQIGSLDFGFGKDAASRSKTVHHHVDRLVGSVRHHSWRPAWHPRAPTAS